MFRVVLVAMMLGASGLAFAQAFPSKTIRVVVTFPPGGGTDALARLLANELTPSLGQPVVVENRPGASGNIGAELVAKSPPDGYTLLMVNSTFAINASVFPNLPFNSVTDFTPVIMLASVPSMIAVPASVPAKNLGELIALAKARPGKLSYASCGSGTPQHLAGELLKIMADIDMTHVPYKGCAPALTDVIGGQLDVSINTAANTIPHLSSGKLRALAVTSKQRFPLAPDVPAVSESGLTGYDVDQWFGLLGPAKLPKDVIDKLNAAVVAALKKPEVIDKMAKGGFAPTSSTPEMFASVVRSDIERWGKLAKQINLKVD